MIESVWYVNERGELVERLPPLPADWRVPDLSHYITGYRAWRVTYRVRGRARIKDLERRVPLLKVERQRADRIQLKPLTATSKGAWPYRCRAEAVCGHASKVAPEFYCGCGIYAKPSLVEAIEYAWRTDPNVVYGAVALWGRVIVHTEGWRAQYAYPLWLFADEHLAQSVLVGLADAYGVKVHVGTITLGAKQVAIYDPADPLNDLEDLPYTTFNVKATITPQGTRR